MRNAKQPLSDAEVMQKLRATEAAQNERKKQREPEHVATEQVECNPERFENAATITMGHDGQPRAMKKLADDPAFNYLKEKKII